MSFAALTSSLGAAASAADSSATALGKLAESVKNVGAAMEAAKLEEIGGEIDGAQAKVDGLLKQLAALVLAGEQFLRSDLMRSALGDLLEKAEAGTLSVKELMEASDKLLANISDGRVYQRMKEILDLIRQIIAAQEKVGGTGGRKGRTPLDDLANAAKGTR